MTSEKKLSVPEQEKHIAAWEKSGLKQYEYCRENKLYARDFMNWVSRSKTRKSLKESRLLGLGTIKIRKHVPREEQEQHIKAWQRGGFTQTSYCQLNNIKIYNFNFWLQAYKKRNEPMKDKKLQIPEQEQHIKAWKDGELNQAEYCREHNIHFKTFNNWVSRYRAREAFEIMNITPTQKELNGMNPEPMTAKERTDTEIQEKHVIAYQKSGLKQIEYCEQNNLVYKTFNNWVYRYRDRHGLNRDGTPKVSGYKKAIQIPAEQQREHIKAWQISDLTMDEYSLAQDIKYKTFLSWVYKHSDLTGKKPKAQPLKEPTLTMNNLAPVIIKTEPEESTPTPTSNSPINLVLSQGRQLQISGDVSPKWLAEFIKCLD